MSGCVFDVGSVTVVSPSSARRNCCRFIPLAESKRFPTVATACPGTATMRRLTRGEA